MKLVTGLAALALVVTATPSAAFAPTSNGAAALSQARGLYYGLQKRGFQSAQCQLRPDWEFILGQPRSASNKPVFDTLDQLRFALTYGLSQPARVVGTDSGGPRNGQADAGIKQIFQGMDQAMNGLFATWSLFMVGSPLPSAATPTTITVAPGGYLLSYKDGDSDVATNLRPNGEIAHIEVKNPQFVSVIEPVFSHTPDGLVLASYKGDYTPTSGKGVVTLEVRLSYQSVNGLQFPSLANIDTTMDGQPSRVRLSLDGCTLTKK